jgi:hypothetical protein
VVPVFLVPLWLYDIFAFIDVSVICGLVVFRWICDTFAFIDVLPVPGLPAFRWFCDIFAFIDVLPIPGSRLSLWSAVCRCSSCAATPLSSTMLFVRPRVPASRVDSYLSLRPDFAVVVP